MLSAATQMDPESAIPEVLQNGTIAEEGGSWRTPLYNEADAPHPTNTGQKPEPLVFMSAASPAEPLPEGDAEATVLNPGGGAFRVMSEVEPKPVEWVVPGLIPYKEITVLSGDGGVGKGMFTAQLAAYVTTGRASELFPAAREDTGNVLILSGEDSIPAVLWPRLVAAEVDTGKVQATDIAEYYKSMGKTPQLDDEELWAMIGSATPSLVVVDPVQSFLPPTVCMNNRQRMRGLLQSLRVRAQQGGFALLLVMHTNKNAGASGRNRVNGSADLWDAARSVLMMGRGRSDGKIYLSHEKSSYSTPVDTILFTTETVEIEGCGRTSRLVFDGTTEWRDADFVREKPQDAAGKSEAVQAEILSILSQSPDGTMESTALRDMVTGRVGCRESTYNHVRSRLTRLEIIRMCKEQRTGFTTLNQGRQPADAESI